MRVCVRATVGDPKDDKDGAMFVLDRRSWNEKRKGCGCGVESNVFCDPPRGTKERLEAARMDRVGMAIGCHGFRC